MNSNMFLMLGIIEEPIVFFEEVNITRTTQTSMEPTSLSTTITMVRMSLGVATRLYTSGVVFKNFTTTFVVPGDAPDILYYSPLSLYGWHHTCGQQNGCEHKCPSRGYPPNNLQHGVVRSNIAWYLLILV